MKALNYLLIAATALTIVSCGAEKSKYTLDTNTAKLEWKGSKDANYFHKGTVKVTEGTIEMEDDKLISGSFKIDLNQIKGDEKELPADTRAYLEEHLKDTSFFFVVDFPIVDVTIDGYENGKLSTTIKVRGQEIKEKIAVKLTSDDKKATIKGKFAVDFAALKVPGFEPDPASGERIQSKIDFDMDLTLNKQ